LYAKSIVMYICPNCGNQIKYQADLNYGKKRLSGAWKVHCLKCNTIHIHRIGRDVNHSSILEGGKLIDVVMD